MTIEVDEMTELAYEGEATSTTTPLEGARAGSTTSSFAPSMEPVRVGETRVTVPMSGDQFVEHGQASASRLIEVGDPDCALVCSDLRSGALADHDGLGLPVTATTPLRSQPEVLRS